MTRHGQFTPATAPRRRASTQRYVHVAVTPIVRHAIPLGITAAGSPTRPGRRFLDTPAALPADLRDRRRHIPKHKSP